MFPSLTAMSKKGVIKLKIKILYITKFNPRVIKVKSFVTYFDSLKFISNNIDKIESMQITKVV